MFDSFSVRARQVVFAARFKAGARGAERIDMDDFLVALILEDQGAVAKTIFSEIHKGQGAFVNQVPFHVPFIPLKTAEDLLANIESLLPQSQPVALTAEIPLSPSLKRVFDSAKAIQTRLQHREIEPLHLLAAILTEESSGGVKLLRDSGITQEKVQLTLSGAAEN